MRVTEEEVRTAYRHARSLGACTVYNDCVGGDLCSPDDASDACVAAVKEYVRLAKAQHAYVHGPMLRDYYSRE